VVHNGGLPAYREGGVRHPFSLCIRKSKFGLDSSHARLAEYIGILLVLLGLLLTTIGFAQEVR
jgi:hypothetical protein